MKKNIIIGFLIFVTFTLGWMYLDKANSELGITCTQQDVQYYLNYGDLKKTPTTEMAKCSAGIQATINYFSAHPSLSDLYIKIPTPTK